MGLVRNLRSDEIVGQVEIAQANVEHRPLPLEVSFMGMGEPLLNTAEVINAIRTFQDVGYDTTLSTTVVPGGLQKLKSASIDVRLQVSLHAPTDELRAVLLPKASSLPLTDLVADVYQYTRTSRYSPIFNYVLLEGINDSIVYAELLCQLLRGIDGIVKTSMYNSHPGLAYRRSSADATTAFVNHCRHRGLSIYSFSSLGNDVGGGCGSLIRIGSNATSRTKSLAS